MKRVWFCLGARWVDLIAQRGGKGSGGQGGAHLDEVVAIAMLSATGDRRNRPWGHPRLRCGVK